MRIQQNKFLNYTITILAMSTLLSACDFFGKKADTTSTTPTGQLANGQSVVGTWTYNYLSASATRNPSTALSETLILDPSGAARYELKDLHSSGGDCIYYGTYSVAAQELIINLLTWAPSTCATGAFQMHLSQIEVGTTYFTYTLPGSTDRYMYFANRKVATNTLVGLWDFNSAMSNANGEGGFDFILFDTYGYFAFQTKIDGSYYVIPGEYTLVSNSDGTTSVRLDFIGDNPNDLYGEPIYFDEYLTDGSHLYLIVDDPTTGQQYVYTGSRL